jgi:hypothetical protein
VQLFAQRVDFGSRLADDDAGTGRVDVDRDLAAALDRDVGKAGVGQFPLDVRADLQVLLEDVGEVLLVEPVRLPGSGPRRCGWFAC